MSPYEHSHIPVLLFIYLGILASVLIPCVVYKPHFLSRCEHCLDLIWPCWVPDTFSIWAFYLIWPCWVPDTFSTWAFYLIWPCWVPDTFSNLAFTLYGHVEFLEHFNMEILLIHLHYCDRGVNSKALSHMSKDLCIPQFIPFMVSFPSLAPSPILERTWQVHH